MCNLSTQHRKRCKRFRALNQSECREARNQIGKPENAPGKQSETRKDEFKEPESRRVGDLGSTIPPVE